jgi:hypothetical protein
MESKNILRRIKMKKLLIMIFVLLLTSTLYAETNKISIEFKNTTVTDAIRSIFKGTNKNFIIESAIKGNVNDMTLIDVDFNDAINAIVKSAGIKCDISKNIYYFGIIKPTLTITLDTSKEQNPAPIEKPTYEKIPIGYADIVDVYSAVSGQQTNNMGQNNQQNNTKN